KALILLDHINRKVVKETVYGVTFIGARLQIEARLKEIENIPQEDFMNYRITLQKRVFSCLEEMFKGAKAIQESVVWTIPLDLPIVQPYRKPNKRQVKTYLQSINIIGSETPSPVNGIKQRAAFSTNFIHSLDATHVLMTTLACKEKELTFASVRDSYCQPIMENLRKEFIERYKGYKVPVKVLRKDLERLKLEKVAKLKLDNSKTIPPVVVVDNGYEDTINLDDLIKMTQKSQSEDIKLESEEEELNLKKKRQTSMYVCTWVDLSFPELPKRGTFDIESVKDSLYFFN
ncbi:9416_t:CDS:2, partial [Cetraspora pellucida]